jgi:dehydrogenase/reductase SDR family protein 4
MQVHTTQLSKSLCICRIGYAVARRLGHEGAKVVVSSRKQKNVDAAVEKLLAEKLDVMGMVCHVGKAEDRTKLLTQVS